MSLRCFLYLCPLVAYAKADSDDVTRIARSPSRASKCSHLQARGAEAWCVTIDCSRSTHNRSVGCRTLRRNFSTRAALIGAGGGAAKEQPMSLTTILVIILILILIGALPTWPYSSGWGYYPSGGLGLIVVILLILLLLGRI